MTAEERLRRRPAEGYVAGVSAGIAHFFGIDPLIIRVAFAALAIAGGFGLLVYGACWAFIPAETEPASDQTRPPTRRPRPRAAIAVGLLVLGALLLVRELGVPFDDGFVWPAVLVAVGIALIWQRSEGERWSAPSFVRQLRERGVGPVVDDLVGRDPQRDTDRLAFLRARLFSTEGGSARSRTVRILAGAALLVGGLGTFFAVNGSVDAARQGLAATLIVAVGILLIFGPGWWRLASDLAEERRVRVRSEERAAVAAHLHDSVLHTLTLIQRHASRPDEMLRLARRQERELRDWLYGPARPRPEGSLAARIEAVADEVEDSHGVTVEVITVGDAPVDDDLEALVQGGREALVNAARHSGDARLAVYLEVDASAATLFVRDRGTGFDRAAVPADRRGITDSIEARLVRHGGTAQIRTSPGEGTEVELCVPRSAS